MNDDDHADGTFFGTNGKKRPILEAIIQGQGYDVLSQEDKRLNSYAKQRDQRVRKETC